jgi:hypothetical protein
MSMTVDTLLARRKHQATRAESAREKTGHERLSTALVFCVIAVTGMEYFYKSQNYILIAFVIAALGFISTGRRLTRHLAPVIGLFFVIEIFQYVIFGGFNFRTFTGTYIRLLLAYFVVALAGSTFPRHYVRILYFFSAVSLLFYAGSFIPGAEQFYLKTLGKLIPNPWDDTEGFYQNKSNFLVYTFEQTLFTEHRNSGPFWEPGGFGVFLIIALIFNHIYDKRIFSRKNIVFMVCILTTLSTSTYICLFLFIVYHNFNRLRENKLYLVSFIIVVAASFVLYDRVPFLKEKVVKNMLLAEETTSSRFGSALADFRDFTDSPLIGYGRGGAKHNFIDEKFFGVEQHRNNGVFNLMVTYGVFITLFYLIRIYRTFRSIRNRYALHEYYAAFGFLLILILGFSQGIFMRPFFYCFLFLPFVFNAHWHRHSHA